MSNKIVTAIGGLGNQMFRYAFYKKMCREYPQISFCMDISDIWDDRFLRGAEFLHVFPNIDIVQASAGEIRKVEHKLTFSYRGKGSRMIRYVVDYINSKRMPDREKYCMTEELFEKKNGMIEEAEWEKIFYFKGYWQKIDYYESYIKELQTDFTFLKIKDRINKEIQKQMQSTQSVSVHIRRGDYVGETLDILDTSYYTDIIRRIQKDTPDSHFFFFSNDADYVKKEYEWLDRKTIIEHNRGVESFRDMQLMSMCKKNIIANSTFSIWAGILNVNAEREVYYPSHYYKNIPMQEIGLDGFIKVEVKNQEGK